MPRVVSPHLTACGASWDDGSVVGGWIAERLGPFGSSVGHAVPRGYEAYAIARIPEISEDDPSEGDPSVPTLAAIVETLRPFGGDDRVHCAMWDGFSFWYDTGGDPVKAASKGMGMAWFGDRPPTQAENDRARAAAAVESARDLVERPDAKRLRLPHRDYYVWTGPPRSVAALPEAPSLVWPGNRSWCVGAPIYTFDIAIGGADAHIDAVCTDPRLDARRATIDDVLEGDD